MVSHGCIISGGRIHRSVLRRGVRINSSAHVEESVLFEGVDVGRHAQIRRAIIDKDVEIPRRHRDRLRPRRRSPPRPHLSEGGVVVVEKEADLTRRDRVFVSEGVDTQQ